jgi:oligopeptidase B
MTRATTFPAIPAPVAQRQDHRDSHHGIERTDEYAWLRADNWQEVFRDPSTLDPAIRTHLDRENEYQSALMQDAAELRRALFEEMKGRIKEDDSSVPMKDGPFAYGTSYRLGGQHPRYFRTPRDGGAEELLLDGDVEAEGKAYFHLGGIEHSSDHRMLLWGHDERGSEFYTLRVRDLDTGKDRAETIGDTGGSGVWDARNEGFFYTRLDANHRPSRVYYHQLGDAQENDHLIFEESDPGFFVSVS